MPTRLGVISFLNTHPLVQPLESGQLAHNFDMRYDVPSRCAQKLHDGLLDVAIIPSIEIARGPEPYHIVPGVGIASSGPVRSVFLLLNKDPEDIRTLALDTSSRTSAALCRILLKNRYNCTPETFPCPPNPEQLLENADAALLIGDPALDLDLDHYRILDLGQAWTEWTGLPFVYACWTGRKDSLPPEETQILIDAKNLGRLNIPQIAEQYAKTHRFPTEFYAEYLTHNTLHDLDEAALQGLRQYYAYAFELGLINHKPDLQTFPQS
ncbi:MAG: menaquinone biosynthesis protein [bacterium]|nr:menaquinone biosynthesis protein [bacterium]